MKIRLTPADVEEIIRIQYPDAKVEFDYDDCGFYGADIETEPEDGK